MNKTMKLVCTWVTLAALAVGLFTTAGAEGETASDEIVVGEVVEPEEEKETVTETPDAEEGTVQKPEEETTEGAEETPEEEIVTETPDAGEENVEESEEETEEIPEDEGEETPDEEEEDATETPDGEEAPEEVPGEEIEEDGEEIPGEDADSDADAGFEESEEELAGEDAPMFTGSVEVELVNTGVICFGDEIILRAKVEDANVEYTLRWEVFRHEDIDGDGEDDWEVIEGEDGEEYRFILDETNVGYGYRVVVVVAK